MEPRWQGPRPNRTGEPGFLISSINEYKNSFILSRLSVPNPPCPLQLTISVLSLKYPRRRPPQRPRRPRGIIVLIISNRGHRPPRLRFHVVDPCLQAV